MNRRATGVSALVVLVLALTSGCALTERRSEIKDAESFPAEPVAQEVARPAAPKLAVILGPGSAKALAHAGVLKELSRARIPIQKVIGLEWGALAGALFAQRGQVNEMEWKLYKLERQSLPSKAFFSGQLRPEPVKGLRAYLQDAFGGGTIGQSAVPFSCPTLSQATGQVAWSDKGDLAAAVENCLALPPLYRAEQGRWAGAMAGAEAVAQLRREGYNPIVVVNVLNIGPLIDEGSLPDQGASVILWLEVRRALRALIGTADEWIEVDTHEVTLSDFAHRREAVAAGERAGAAAAKRLSDRFGF